MIDDVTRWNFIHQKTHSTDLKPSKYAEDKEKLFPRNCLIVDLGGGAGFDSVYFLKQGHNVVLFDISDVALSLAEEKAKEIGLGEKLVTRQIDFGLHDLPIKDNSVDVVFSRIALHYFESTHTIQLFKHIYRMLKPGGCAYLTFKSPEDTAEMQRLAKTATLFEPNVYIENGLIRSRFTPTQLKNMLAKAGVPKADVHSYKEDIQSGDLQSHVLLLNEVLFTK
jgi:ubiquinone/menaquinone biosynthesis C-methylase UbiE